MGSAWPSDRCQATKTEWAKARDKAPKMGPLAENSVLIISSRYGRYQRPWFGQPQMGVLHKTLTLGKKEAMPTPQGLMRWVWKGAPCTELVPEGCSAPWPFCGKGFGAPLLGADGPQEAHLWEVDLLGPLLSQLQKGPEARIHLPRVLGLSSSL